MRKGENQSGQTLQVYPGYQSQKERKVTQLLSPKLKKVLFSQLKNIAPDKLQEALLSAVFEMIRFPHSLNKKIHSLQQAYVETQHNVPVQILMRQVIQTYIHTEGLTVFMGLLLQPFVEQEWSSRFLMSMAESLRLSVVQEPLVEVVVVDGKVHWQIVKGDAVLYRPQGCSGLRALGLATWHLTWKQFRRFKDSGKRHGTVAITKERFVAYFPRHRQQRAAMIWDELKQRGVLNHKDRIAVSWHILSTDYIYLDSIGAGIDYLDIANAINAIASQVGYREVLPVGPEFSIFRSDRGRKVWWGTGRIENDGSNKPRECSRLWDVGVYHDLTLHSYSEKERQRTYKKPLNYEHVPSECVLADKKDKLINKCSEEIASIKQRIKSLSERIEAEKAKLALEASRYPTRHQLRVADNEVIRALLAELKILQQTLDGLLQRQQYLRQEAGKSWWAVAIPETLHKQGESYLQSKKVQLRSTKHPFLSNVTAYLDMLEKRPEDFSLGIEDYLLALGAFRVLYRQQVKPSKGVMKGGKIPLTSQAFFKLPEDRRAIDALFNERMSRHLKKIEGISPSADIPTCVA